MVLLGIGLGATLALTTLAGNAQTFDLLLRANAIFIALLIAVQALRYVAMAISTRAVAGIVGVRVRLPLLFRVTVAAQAANRTFFGGAAGFVIRLAFFLKQGMPGGAFVAVETVEDSASLAAISLLFVAGAAAVLATTNATGVRWDVIGSFVVGALVLALIAILLLRQRVWLERTIHTLVQEADRIASRFVRRSLYDAVRVTKAVEDFYAGLHLARGNPRPVVVSFFSSLVRLGCDATGLYLAFRAIGLEVAPGLVLLIFVVSSTVATISTIPGQIGVMETTLSLMSTALGIPPPVAVSAALLYRVVSFWLPVPLAYFFAWELERKGLI